MEKAQITLTLQQLYIAEHGIRYRLKRPGIAEHDKAAEERALDAVNKGIHAILRGSGQCNQ